MKILDSLPDYFLWTGSVFLLISAMLTCLTYGIQPIKKRLMFIYIDKYKSRNGWLERRENGTFYWYQNSITRNCEALDFEKTIAT